MSEFAEQFRAYVSEQRSLDEEIQRQAANTRRDRDIGIRIIEARKMELQVVVANFMRAAAKEIIDLKLIPKDIEPTTLVITKAEFVSTDSDGTAQGRRQYNEGGMKIDTSQLGRKKAFMVSPRYQRTVDDDAQTMIFTPIFVTEDDGDLWIAPKHELRTYEDYSNMPVQKMIGIKQARYRRAMRGQELEGRPKRYRSWVDSNSPRPATDEDLVPIERLSVLQLEGDYEKVKQSEVVSGDSTRTEGLLGPELKAIRLPELVLDFQADLLAMVKL